MKLKDRVAVITGAGAGIGRATALLFAEEGAKVVVDDIVVDVGEETAKLIREKGGEAVFVEADVSKTQDVERMIQTAIDTYGRLDILHNNAGIEGERRSIRKYHEEEWDRVMGINLKGVFLGSKYAIPHMLNQGGGVIVNTASVAGLVGMTHVPAYCASKGGVVLLTKSMALEYAKKNIRVNCICPGGVLTPLFERSVGTATELADKIRKQWPIGRWAKPEEIAQAALFLASDQSSYMTGAALVIDGGWTVQ